MRLTCSLDEEIICLLTAIAEKKGEVKTFLLNQLEAHSREENKIDSVHATIFLQNRTLKRETTADVIRHLSIRAPGNRIKEIRNTMAIYESLSTYNPISQESIKRAYLDLLAERNIKRAYRKEIVPLFYRTGNVGLSPPVKEMQKGMKELFHYLRHGKDPLLIKGCLCHYAIQLYQPFEMENEKMSRLWHTLLLIKEHPFFEFIPWEKEILTKRKEYFSNLPGPEQSTDSSEFTRYMLGIINIALSDLLELCRKSVKPMDRVRYFYTLGHSSFTRKDYMRIYNNISVATASRDLNLGVESGFFVKHGTYNQSTYECHLLFE